MTAIDGDGGLMNSIEELDELRDRLLDALYDAGGERINWGEWASDQGLDQDLGDQLATWLIDRELARSVVMGRWLEIAPHGQDVVEERRRRWLLDQGEASFDLPVVTVDEHRVIEAVRTEIRRFLDEHADDLEVTARQDVEQQLATVDEQMRSPRPRKRIIGAAFAALRWTLNAAGQGAVGVGAAELARRLGV